jgi:aspartate aminotransferase
MTSPVSQHLQQLMTRLSPVYRFFTQSVYARRGHEPGINDFAIGNPHEMPLPAFAETLQRWAVPQHKDWFAYPDNHPGARAAVAAALLERRGVAYDPADIHLTNGAFAALAVALKTLVDPGEEVIFFSPPWFYYEAMIAANGSTPVPVKVRPDNFDLDLEALAAAITPRTRAVLVNSPNNPTGRIYPPETLADLGRLLTDASQRHGRPIYLISDEAYSRILFDGQPFPSPTQHYPASVMLYTYGKTLLTPGERMGYLALGPDVPGRQALRDAIFVAQLLLGYAFPNALLQHALPELENLSIDLDHLQRKRDRMVTELRRQGYELHVPEGTFYLLPRSPLADDWAFTELLAEHDTFVLPGTVVEMPGYFRISLTASDDMIERGLPAFAATLQRARQMSPGAVAAEAA